MFCQSNQLLVNSVLWYVNILIWDEGNFQANLARVTLFSSLSFHAIFQHLCKGEATFIFQEGRLP